MQYVKRIVDYVDVHKRINRDAGKIEAEVKIIMKAVDQVNAAHELDLRIGGEQLSQIFLPDWTRPMVFPKKVSALPGFKMTDILKRPDKDPDWVYDSASVTLAAHRVSQYFKCDANMVSATDLRGDCAVMSEVDFTICGKVDQKSDELFCPVPLADTHAALFEAEWGNMELQKMLDLYFSRQFTMASSRKES